MKVAIVMPLAEQRGGGELMLLDLLEHGRGMGVDWTVIFLESGPMTDRVNSWGIKTYIIPCGQLREIHRWWSTVNQIAQLLKQECIEVVIGWMWKGHLYSGPAAQKVGVPCIWYQLENPGELTLLKRLANALPAAAIITLSKSGQEIQSQLKPNCPIKLVYPGASIDRFNPKSLPSVQEVREKLGLPNDRPIIGIIGRLQKWKGMHVVVEAMPKILSQYPDTLCLIVGGKHNFEPDYENLVAERIHQLGIGENVRMVGLQKNVPEWMQAMDVIVHASDHEPFGIVVVEAMAMGKAVVASASGGPVEIITPKLNGLLTNYGDADQLAEGILSYLKDQSFADAIGQAARDRAENFSTQQYAKNFILKLGEIIENSSQGQFKSEKIQLKQF
jgi:glycosyltransferase involved in cell wall biosynthesis